jgi:hypothetical protein
VLELQRKASIEPLVHSVSERIERLVGWQLHLLLAPRAVRQEDAQWPLVK